MSPIADRITSAFPDTIDRLSDLVRIPSCSFPGFDPVHLATCARACADWLRQIGFPEVNLITDASPGPYVIARDHRAGPDKPTVLLYAHHDVQPPMREELWTTPAYEPTIRDGRLFGRGAADDKAGVAAIAAACAGWLADNGSLPVNVTVLIEGEEEVGSPHLGSFLANHIDTLQADLVVIADLVNVAVGLPSLTVALRGITALSVEVRGLAKPVHSGMWGGPVPDAATALIQMLASCHDQQGELSVPGLPPATPDAGALADLERVPYDAAEFHRQAGMLPGYEDLVADGLEVYRKLWYAPSLSFNGIHAGGAEGQAGNIVVDRAWARMSLRLAPGQDPEVCTQALTAHLQAQAPAGVEVQVTPEAAASAWTTRTDHPVFDLARKAFAAGYGADPVAVGCGGTIPFVGELTERLGGVPALLIPVEDPDTNAHAEDESVHLDDLRRTSISLAILLELLAGAD